MLCPDHSAARVNSPRPRKDARDPDNHPVQALQDSILLGVPQVGTLIGRVANQQKELEYSHKCAIKVLKRLIGS